MTQLYEELDGYSKGRSTNEILPKSLTNTYLIVSEFYRAGKLSQPIGALNDVITHWFYNQTEGIDKSRVVYLKEFNRISHFIIGLKECYDLLDEIGQDLQITNGKYEKSKEEEEQEEKQQALSELWEEVEEHTKKVAKSTVSYSNKADDIMFNVMNKMNDCKDTCMQLKGILSVETDEAERIYFTDMYKWVVNKLNTMRSDLQSIFDLERSRQVQF